MVAETNTIPEPDAVVIHAQDARLAILAMMRPIGLEILTVLAEPFRPIRPRTFGFGAENHIAVGRVG